VAFETTSSQIDVLVKQLHYATHTCCMGAKCQHFNFYKKQPPGLRAVEISLIIQQAHDYTMY